MNLRSSMKLVVVRLDRRFFGGFLTNLRNLKSSSRDFIYLSKKTQTHSLHINYNSRANSLAYLCHKFGTDKGEIKEILGDHKLMRGVHNYSDFYDLLLSHRRLNVKRVFECGIGTNNELLESSMGKRGIPGASLRVWQEYFPEAVVIGADIDADTLFEDSRISTYFVDQTKPESIRAMWEKVGHEKFDLMIDDGLHTFAAGITLFENSSHLLDDFGVYVIEDVNPWDVASFEEYFQNLELQVYFVHLLRRGKSLGDNSLVVIKKVPDLGSRI